MFTYLVHSSRIPNRGLWKNRRALEQARKKGELLQSEERKCNWWSNIKTWKSALKVQQADSGYCSPFLASAALREREHLPSSDSCPNLPPFPKGNSTERFQEWFSTLPLASFSCQIFLGLKFPKGCFSDFQRLEHSSWSKGSSIYHSFFNCGSWHH